VNQLSLDPVSKEIITDNASVSVYTDVFNKRIRIDEYAGDLMQVLGIINDQLADWVEKLIVKSYQADVAFFISQGFNIEAIVKGYYAGADMYFVTRYFSVDRERTNNWSEEQLIIQKLLTKQGDFEITSFERVEIKEATVAQASQLAHLYKKIFPVYPTPLTKEDYILKTIQQGTLYVYIEKNSEVISAASAEINWKHKNAELTDCATLPEAAGKGYMKRLLYYLEQKLNSEGIVCCYTIARAESYSMNKAFAQLGYAYGGRLINNCFIYSGIEDMNVWYKTK